MTSSDNLIPQEELPSHDHRPQKQEQEAASDEVTEVAPNVIRTQLPVNLPGLGHVNCYLIEDERGIAVVDPGLPGEDSWKALSSRLRTAGYTVNNIHTVIVTHSHFDHFGGAERIRKETGAKILTHKNFRKAFNRNELEENEDSGALDPNSEEAQQAVIDRIFSERLPWGTKRTKPPQKEIERFRKMGRFNSSWFKTPEPNEEVEDNDIVKLGGREWLSIHTPGHTNDHLCLWDPANGIMFSGDHVLPSITPHIGGITPESDPLSQFFGSLERMTQFENVVIALPAHGHPFTNLRERSNEIIDHHQERLQTIRDASNQLIEGTVTDYMRVLFSERAWGDMAESETYAHLEHLKEAGELKRDSDNGLFTYTNTQ
jgi:glyoxylase-like metal-dependent hydrolase (beta-lactamase superfamily II)